MNLLKFSWTDRLSVLHRPCSVGEVPALFGGQSLFGKVDKL